MVLTQVQAPLVTAAQAEEALALVLPNRPRVVSLAADNLHEVVQDMRAVAAAVGRLQQGQRYRDDFARRLSGASAVCKGLREPRVACINWADPVYTSGSWTPELIRLAGGGLDLSTRSAGDSLAATAPGIPFRRAGVDVFAPAPLQQRPLLEAPPSPRCGLRCSRCACPSTCVEVSDISRQAPEVLVFALCGESTLHGAPPHLWD